MAPLSESKAPSANVSFSLGESISIEMMPPPTDVVREGKLLCLVWGTVDPDLRAQLQHPSSQASLSDLAASIHGSTSGVYFLLLRDDSTREAAFFVDLFSCKKMFYCQRGDTLYFSTNLARLVAASIVRPEVDLATVATFLMYDYVPTNHTLLCGVRSVGAFTWYHLRNNTLSEFRVWPFKPMTVSEGYRDLVRETFARLESAFVSGSSKVNSLIVPLSGGRDSRLLLGLALRHQKHKISTLTFGQPGTLDFEIGTGLARKLQLDRASYAIGRDFYSAHVIPSTPFLNGLINHVLAPSNFVSQRFRSASDQAVLSGYIGDLVIGWKEGAIHILKQDGVRYPAPKQLPLCKLLQLLPRAKEQILERLDELQRTVEAFCVRDAIPADSWYYRIRVTTFTAVGLFSEQDEGFRYLTPYVNVGFLRWMLSLPHTLKANPAFYRDLVGLNEDIAALFKFPLKTLNGAAYFCGPVLNSISVARYAWRAFTHRVRPKQNFARYENFYPVDFISSETFEDTTLQHLFENSVLLGQYQTMTYEQKMLLLSLRLHLRALLETKASQTLTRN